MRTRADEGARVSRRAVIELIVVVVAIASALVARTFVFAIYAIPSESMLPGLQAGDYLLVEKWPYGWARARLPFASPTATGRWHGSLPARGDIVVFKAPPSGRSDYVKRVIGLPGDRVALRAGQIVLNGRPVPRWRIADLVAPVTPNAPCRADGDLSSRIEREAGGRALCRSARWREMLPGGRMVDTLDLGITGGDEFAPIVVPPGRLFLLGDDRDRSADSRWPAREGEGIGLVPVDALVGRARVIVLSVDGSARLREPRSWWRALRLERIGAGF